MNEKPQGFGQGGPVADWHQDGETPETVTKPTGTDKKEDK